MVCRLCREVERKVQEVIPGTLDGTIDERKIKTCGVIKECMKQAFNTDMRSISTKISNIALDNTSLKAPVLLAKRYGG
jgi:hypothetical protein